MATYQYIKNVNPYDATVVVSLAGDKSVGLGGKVDLDEDTYQELSERFVLELVKDRPKVVQNSPEASSKPSDKA